MSEIDGRTVRSAHRRKPNRNAWTAAKRKTFLQVLAETCNVQAAERAAGIGAGSAYCLRLRDGEFARLWAAAMETGYVRLEAALLRRAMGAPRPDNPPLAELVATDDPSPAALDVDLAVKLLTRRRGEDHGARASGGPPPRQPSPADIYRALERKLTAIEKRLARHGG